MPQFFDLHSHILCEVDDGARSSEEMYSMLEMAYEDGVRAICFTPHFAPYLFGDTSAKSKAVFDSLQAEVAKTYPDLQLFLGHELGYHHGCIKALMNGTCRTINNSRYVLVDFLENVEFFELRTAIDQLQRSGYFVILAHAERYRCLYKEFRWFESFVDAGGIVQLNASSCCGEWGKCTERQWKKLIRKGYAHIISSDGHHADKRLPKMSVCMPYLQKHLDEPTVNRLIWENAMRVVSDKLIEF